MSFEFKKEPLGPEHHLYVSAAHTFGTDAFLLAEFAGVKPRETVCDLGTGCGIIPMIFAVKNANSVTGVEISPEASSLFQKTIDEYVGGTKLKCINADMKALSDSDIECGGFGLVTCNPPYFTPGSGYLAPQDERKNARAETSCTINDVCAAAKYLLKYGGRLCVCYRSERLCDLMCAMREAGIEPKRLRFVAERPESAPWLVLVEGKRGGKPSLVIEPPLVMRDKKGNYSDEIEKMYTIYRRNN